MIDGCMEGGKSKILTLKENLYKRLFMFVEIIGFCINLRVLLFYLKVLLVLSRKATVVETAFKVLT